MPDFPGIAPRGDVYFAVADSVNDAGASGLAARGYECEDGEEVFLSTGTSDSAQLRAKGVQSYGIGAFGSTGAHGNDERMSVRGLGVIVEVIYNAVLGSRSEEITLLAKGRSGITALP